MHRARSSALRKPAASVIENLPAARLPALIRSMMSIEPFSSDPNRAIHAVFTQVELRGLISLVLDDLSTDPSNAAVNYPTACLLARSKAEREKEQHDSSYNRKQLKPIRAWFSR